MAVCLHHRLSKGKGSISNEKNMVHPGSRWVEDLGEEIQVLHLLPIPSAQIWASDSEPVPSVSGQKNL